MENASLPRNLAMKEYTARRTMPQGRELLSLIFAIGVVLFIGMTTYANWVEFRRAGEQQDISRRIMRATNTVLSTLRDAETAQRGFLLTGEENYLRPYNEAVSRIPKELAELTIVTAPGPDQSRRVEAVKPLVQNKLHELLQTIELSRAQGSGGALSVVMSGQGKATMDQIRRIFAEMESVADGRSARQSAEMLDRIHKMALIGTLGPVALLALLMLATATIRQGTRRRLQLIQNLEESYDESRQARDWFQTTLTSIGDAVIATDAAAKITFLNEVAESLTGWTQEEATGVPLDQVFVISHEDTGATVESPVTRVLREGRIVGLANHTSLTAKNGRQTPIDDSAAPIRNAAGNLSGVVLVFRNISERKQAESELKQAEQRFRTAVSAVSDILWTNNAKGEMEGEQPGWGGFTGQSLDEYQGYGWAQAVHPDDARPSIAEWNRAVAERRKFVFEHRVRRHDGVWRVCSICALPILDATGAIREWVGVHTDITERKQIEEKLLEAEERFRAIADNIPQLAWIADAGTDGQVHWFNRNWFLYTGTTLEEMQGSGWHKVHHPDYAERVIRKFSDHVKAAVDWEDSFPLRDKDGNYRWFLSRMNCIRDPSGKVVRIFGTNTDITDQREVENLLRRANQDLESFAYSASHDLQEPLRMITIYAQMLVNGYRGQLDGEAALCVDYITDGTRRMRELLSDLLTYTAVDAQITDEAESIDLNLLVEDVIKNMKVSVEESGAVVTSAPLPVISGHRAHFVQLFQNLVSNAIKYRSECPCRVHVSVEEQNGTRRFAVADNGIGIAPEYHENIFGVFKRLHGKVIPGTGIGLAICQRVVERYKGRIWVESAPDQGATFCFTLPVSSEAGKFPHDHF
jgi:PAS domain S-box-containing protein